MNLSDIPTPLTDAAEYHPLSDNYLFVVDADFARDLERKLSAAIAEQNRLNEYYQYEAIKLRHTTEERDEAKRKLAEADADAKASEMMLRQVCEERDALRTYAGSQTFRSDFRTADELRAAYDEARKQNAVLRKALKNLVPLASIHQTQPENMTETDFYNLIVALSSARATLAATEEKV